MVLDRLAVVPYTLPDAPDGREFQRRIESEGGQSMARQSTCRLYFDAGEPHGKYITELMGYAADVYNNALLTYTATKREKDIWLNHSELLKLVASDKLHETTNNLIVYEFFQDWWRWIEVKKINPDKARKKQPRQRGLHRITWSRQAMSVSDNKLFLVNGRENDPLVIDNWTFDVPDKVRITPRKRGYHTMVAYYFNRDIRTKDLAEIGGR